MTLQRMYSQKCYVLIDAHHTLRRCMTIRVQYMLHTEMIFILIDAHLEVIKGEREVEYFCKLLCDCLWIKIALLNIEHSTKA